MEETFVYTLRFSRRTENLVRTFCEETLLAEYKPVVLEDELCICVKSSIQDGSVYCLNLLRIRQIHSFQIENVCLCESHDPHCGIGYKLYCEADGLASVHAQSHSEEDRKRSIEAMERYEEHMRKCSLVV